MHSPKRALVLLLMFALLSAPLSMSYSVLTHEQIVDLVWDAHMKKLLLQRFPSTTPDDLKKAHAYAYGGCVIQDMGYYPFGSHYFSDLVHYVRGGDFVAALLKDSQDVNEYAFALGALTHYTADISGHPAVNTAVGMQFPKLAAKYGPQVTFADDPTAHIRTEFGFDVLQVAKNRYASDAYHDFIGFEVSKPLLERAFQETYGIELKNVFANEDLAIGSYRRSIASVIPEMTRVALKTKRTEMIKEDPTFAQKKFLYYLSRADYEKSWGHNYKKPGIGARILAWIFKIIPKVGPFKAIAFETPTPATENLYLASVDKTVELLAAEMDQLRAHEKPQLPNDNYDTGKPTRAGQYSLSDRAYARLVNELADHQFSGMSAPEKDDILHFYASLDGPIATKKNKDDWAKLQKNLAALKTAQPQPITVPAAQPATSKGQ